ncbi:MAG: hypothetical protein WDN69_29625 [Aliidongia sp.]
MKRTHRRWHYRIWIVLPFLTGLGFMMALVLRPSPTRAVSSTTIAGSP